MSEAFTNRLTTKQLRFLEQLVEYQAREGVPPSVREMQALCGFRSPRSVAQFLDALEQGGYIERAAGARNVRIVRRPAGSAAADRANTVLVPLLGRVAAGQPILAAENVEDHIPVSTSLARGNWSYFILRVKGDSMDLAGILDGDLVLVRQQETAEHGQQVVALIDDSATIKRLRIGKGALLLEPLSTNPVHRPIVVGPDFRVQGIVVATVPGSE